MLIASLSMERYSAAATVGRRDLWINALGYDSKEWKYSPGNHRRLGNGWLQEAYSHSSQPYPRHGSGLRWLWTFSTVQAADVLDRRYPRVRTRSRGRALFGKNNKKQQPRDQLAAIGQLSGTESPAAK